MRKGYIKPRKPGKWDTQKHTDEEHTDEAKSCFINFDEFAKVDGLH